MFCPEFNSNGGSSKQLFLNEAIWGHKCKDKYAIYFLQSCHLHCDVTAKNTNIKLLMHFVPLYGPRSKKLLPSTPIRIQFWMKYQILGFLTGTQILASLPNLLSPLLTLDELCFCYCSRHTCNGDGGDSSASPIKWHIWTVERERERAAVACEAHITP